MLKQEGLQTCFVQLMSKHNKTSFSGRCLCRVTRCWCNRIFQLICAVGVFVEPPGAGTVGSSELLFIYNESTTSNGLASELHTIACEHLWS